MLARILEVSLRHRVVVIAAWIGIAAAGVMSALQLPLDAFPDTTPVQVQVHAQAPALAPEEIERRLATPIERAISGLPGLEDVRSVSRFGFCVVTATFVDGTDVARARQSVSERLLAVELPPEVAPPRLGPIATGLGEVFHYLVTGQGRSLAELRTAQDWVIAPQLRAVSGVAEVNGWGGEARQVHVVVDPARLARWGLTLDEVASALARENAAIGGGVLASGGEGTLVQGLALARSREDVEAMIVGAREGVPIRVRDVADVVEGHEIRRGAVTSDGRGEAVLGLGFMLLGENSREVTERLAARLREVRRSLPAGIEVTPVYERTALVDRVLRTVRNNLLLAAALVIAVLFVFLGELRAGLIVAAAIPLSLLFASNLMLQAGVAGSLMSLGAIDFGLVVDSSVIQVENVVRRLGADPGDRPRLEVVREAVLEVRRPTILGELVIAVVYLPVLALEGIEGKLFRPMALTVIFALAGSLLLSLTLVPALASLSLSRRAHADRVRAPLRILRRAYAWVLEHALRRPRLVLAGACLVLVLGAVAALGLGTELVPRLHEGTIVINTVRLSGVSLEESVRYGTRIERFLRERFPDEIERVWTRTGTAEIATDPMGVELSDVFVTLRPRERWRRASTQEDLSAQIREAMDGLPGMRVVMTQPIEMRLAEMIGGIRSDVGVKVFGPDLSVLASAARDVERILRATPGAADVYAEQTTGQPVLGIELDRIAMGRHGVRAPEALAAIEALGGLHVGEIYEQDRRFPIAVRLAERHRTDSDAVGRVLVASAAGPRVPLHRIAALDLRESPAAIQREWGQRRVVVQANVRDRDLGSFVRDARARIEREVRVPPGYWIRWGGQFEHFERARTRLLIVVPLALIAIFVLLYLTYGRITDALRVFTGVPFAAVGGVLALSLRGLPFSVSAAVGFIALSGVAVLADMVLVSRMRQHLEAGLAIGEAVRRAADERLRPVLMTALVAALGFLPMALATGPGAEVQRPLATVLVGGVCSSTLLTLIVLPVLFSAVQPRSEGE